MHVEDVQKIIDETSALIRDKLQPLLDAGFYDVDIRVYTVDRVGNTQLIDDVDITLKVRRQS